MIIVGLGNPGQDHAKNRHNVGFMIVDRLVKIAGGAPWKVERKVAWSKIGDHWIIKPIDYMNRSGQALKDFLDYKKIPHADTDLWGDQGLIVVHDELDFPVETFKLQSSKSSAGHNGVRSIHDAWNGWDGFDRLRFGIGDNREQNLPSEDYVLRPFTSEEWKLVEPKIDQAAEFLKEKLVELSSTSKN